MKKVVINIEDLVPQSILNDIHKFLKLHIEGMEKISNKFIDYDIKLGTINLEFNTKRQTNRNVKIIKSIIVRYFDHLCLKDKIYAKSKRSRKRKFCYPRQLTACFIDKYTKLSLAEIGEEIGSYDHSTVLYSKKVINNFIDTDEDVKNDVENIEQLINKKLGIN